MTMDSMFETLADPTRRRIVEALLAGEQPVKALVDAVDIRQSGVSRHLRILREAGFVDVRADGQLRLYRLRPEPFREIDLWVSRYRRLWEARFDALEDALQRKRADTTPPRS
ncbi:MAG: winged helix-turn-helix transcriptional regulator [Alphaproteobacteria bacterium]|nr:winged helix-turn-helix transcriptional regulator [Alphaproteobacteria bacterium]